MKVENFDDARRFVQEWLWESEARTTINREWDRQFITDAAEMVLCALKEYQFSKQQKEHK